MPRIAIGAGIVLAILATFGAFGSISVAVTLLTFGVMLIVYGGYEEWIMPRFRVDVRLTDWFQRRGWSVTIERRPQFNFLLHLTSSSSGKEVVVTRDKTTRDSLVAFTGGVPYHETWHEILPTFSEQERESVLSEIRIYLTAKNLSINLAQLLDGRIIWPPHVVIQTALPQDHTLSQHSVDMAAKSIELSVIGVRALIRKAVANHGAAALGDTASSPTPSPGSIPDTASPQPQKEP